MEKLLQKADGGFNRVGWKYYNKIKKKAMEQEFSWSGLVVSLSIAFFVVTAVSFSLNLVYESVEKVASHNNISTSAQSVIISYNNIDFGNI
jgi:hypothetical protein